MSIYTIHILPEYRDFASSLLFAVTILITLHLLMSNQKSTGLLGSLFNEPFSETFCKILVSLAFYYLVVREIISFA
jgi:hypothetical protein